ncbi:MAG: hypothetical protein M5R42_12090 [Rhodocyclaceae bacterium]|nr:hypothetical protein [Rhodocyclaceae bacterium]
MDEQSAGRLACLLEGCQALKEQVRQLVQANESLGVARLGAGEFSCMSARAGKGSWAARNSYWLIDQIEYLPSI